MKVKKFTALFLSLCMCVSLTACGSTSSDEKGTSADSDEKKDIAFLCESIGDRSVNDSAWAGLQSLEEKGWKADLIETGDASKADKYDDFILDAIDNGADYIVTSSTYTENCLNLAKEYGDVKFIIFDDYQEAENLPDNVSVIYYKQNEGAYLVGILAAGMTETKEVAVNVGIENPIINDFVTGFVEGVKSYDPEVKVIKAAVNSWYDPTKMKEICLSQNRDNNVDVFFPVAGASGDGAYEACSELKTWAIGVDSDLYAIYKDSENPEIADVILTSMLKKMGDSLVTIFDKIEKNEDIWKQSVIMGLQEDAVGYVDNDYFEEKVPKEVRDAMADAEKSIKSGELTVKSFRDFADENEYVEYVDAAR